jgi:hypothetical protein
MSALPVRHEVAYIIASYAYLGVVKPTAPPVVLLSGEAARQQTVVEAR